MDRNKKIVDLTEEELASLGYLTDKVAPPIKKRVEAILADRKNLGYITVSMVESIMIDFIECEVAVAPNPASRAPPTSPTSRVNEADTSAFIVVPPDLVTEYERINRYRGISLSPPPFLWRTDLKERPFPMPTPGERYFSFPVRTAHGVIDTPLNNVWPTVAPLIIASIKARGIKYTSVQPVRFSIVEGDKDEYLGPVVVWIAIPCILGMAYTARDATPDILRILADAQITDVVVEWYEATITKLAGPPLMAVEDYTSAAFGLNHPFNVGLGVPIARQSDDSQGTLAFFFREVRTKDGKPSDRILGVTNKHVACLDRHTHYEFQGTGDPEHILVCSDKHFTIALGAITKKLNRCLQHNIELSMTALPIMECKAKSAKPSLFKP